MTAVASRFFITVGLLILVSACTVAPTYKPQPPVDDRSDRTEPPQPQQDDRYEPYDEPAQTSPMPDAEPRPQSEPAQQPQVQQNSAVIALLDNADQSRATGDYRAAQSSLQRAQRIAPRDPEVYYSLALTHMELEDYGLAEQVTLKGVSVAQGNRNQLKRLWNLIAKIRLRAGDASGSRDATAKSSRY
ncbi:tetratricopeptide repeat protein [Methylophaga sp.]|uniref:tetratricopeptide repeat protein n=1 Tax=Methylophaga sp. TaxID=2024840 RepID=UPI003F6A408D